VKKRTRASVAAASPSVEDCLKKQTLHEVARLLVSDLMMKRIASVDAASLQPDAVDLLLESV
jgi:hypothetical protein